MSQNQESNKSTRRDFLGNLAMWGGLLLAYGALGIEGILFLLPKNLQSPTRRLFAGNLKQYQIGGVQSFFDLQGSEIMVRRGEEGMQAFSTVCPHLGCRVHWEEDNHRFFCPCHRGVFDENGVAVSGPPKDSQQDLIAVPITVEEESGTVFLEVKDTSNS